MKYRLFFICLVVSCIIYKPCRAHDIVFCGERIPVENGFIASKLMDAIRRQMPNVNFPSLSRRARENFPVVEYYLRETGLPLDFKYLAIVESGFQNITSKVGARGFWQLMPETAVEKGLTVSLAKDDRDNIHKATYAACRVLAEYYLLIKRNYGISSWVLTAAAYNLGIGRITKAINRQGADYFSMSLNPETAAYVYKIIAVKELFEYPELYMKDFGYNVFTASLSSVTDVNVDTTVFNSMTLNVKENDGNHPASVVVSEKVKTGELAGNAVSQPVQQPALEKSTYVTASIKGKYKDFADGETIYIVLQQNLEVKGSFNSKGNELLAKGWVIDGRVYVDLGFDDRDVVVFDTDYRKGLLLSSLKNKKTILLKVLQEE
ncbi:lytic transglycosylase domain-containing protein [Foetidibacter luteolus]|uniref:lytic transglycosylase domain-containing protein n=1 Tax=Foetidibacter luteolus TaxID=2608880 RepID=UPI00129B029F|nr:lytic transglycosylase domain-containing protein [Foetidibacter luteolus]